MPFAVSEIELMTPYFTLSFTLPSLTTKKRAKPSDAAFVVNTYESTIDQPAAFNYFDVTAAESTPRCGMALDPLERYEIEMQRIETRKLQEALAVQDLIQQDRERWEAREASKRSKKGHRRSSSALDIVKKLIHRRVDSGIAFTEEKKGALEVEAVLEVEEAIDDSTDAREAPRLLKERVRNFLKYLRW